MTEADEKSVEIVFTILLDLVPIDENVINHELLARDHVGDVEPERRDVLADVRGGFLERHQHAGFAELERTAHEKLRRHERFSAAGGAADQGGPAGGQTATRDFVEARYSSGHLYQAVGIG